jgi:hypothetical protein
LPAGPTQSRDWKEGFEIAAATNCGPIKTGSLSHPEGSVQFAAVSRRQPRLRRIEPLLGKNAVYAGTSALPKARRLSIVMAARQSAAEG